MADQRLQEIKEQLYGCAELTPTPEVLDGIARWLMDLEQQAETAESVAQMAAHDRDEALEQAAQFEKDYARLQQAARSILWMAREYAEGGGRGGPEMRDYEAAAAIIEDDEDDEGPDDAMWEPEPRAGLAYEQP